MHAHVLTTDSPAPTSNIHITSTVNNTEESIVSLEWDYVSDGAPVNYSVTVNGGPDNETVSAVTVEMGVELTLIKVQHRVCSVSGGNKLRWVQFFLHVHNRTR